jgi:diacylglycerol kinase
MRSNSAKPHENPMSWHSTSPGEVPEPAAPPWDSEAPAGRAKPRRKWRDKFGDAFRGMKLGIRGHSSFFVHFFFAALVAATALVMRCEIWEWCLLLGCIGFVLTAELFNSAIEALFHGQEPATKARSHACLDIAAGAVLMASVTALVVGGLVFLNRLAALLLP